MTRCRIPLFKTLRLPVIQAPMIGATDARMVHAACRASILGSLGAGSLPAHTLRESIRDIRQSCGGPFNINLFIIDEHRGEAPSEEVVSDLRAYISRLEPRGCPPLSIPQEYAPSFSEQFAVLLDEAPPVCSFTFGILSRDQVGALKARGSYVVGTATTLAEAIAWEAAGADAICLQGIESGGHRGSFLPPSVQGEEEVGLLGLVSCCRGAVSVPLIAAGGIMTGRGILAALVAGADVVQMGTAFLCCDEAPTPSSYRRALMAARGRGATVLIREFSGKAARGLPNAFTNHFRGKPVAPYPIHNALTQGLRGWAARCDDAGNMSLWAGQGHHLIRDGSLASIVHQLEGELRDALAVATAWRDPVMRLEAGGGVGAARECGAPGDIGGWQR